MPPEKVLEEGLKSLSKESWFVLVTFAISLWIYAKYYYEQVIEKVAEYTNSSTSQLFSIWAVPTLIMAVIVACVCYFIHMIYSYMKDKK